MRVFVLQEGEWKEITNLASAVELFETKGLMFRLESDALINDPALVFGDSMIKLHPVEVEVEDVHAYESYWGKYFINHVGMAICELVDGQSTPYSVIGCINVLSGKITTERLYGMLDYIYEHDNNLLHCCFSKTLLSFGGGELEYTDLHAKLIQTETILEYLWDNRNRFKNQPCRRIKSKEVVKKYESTDSIDDRTITWLLSNPSELTLTNDPSRAIFQHYTQLYTADNILTSQVIVDTDIYENQVIYSFLIEVKKFLGSVLLITDTLNVKSKINNKEHSDVIPLIQSFVIKKLTLKNKKIERLLLLVNNCIKFTSKHLSNTYHPHLKPKITQYVSRNSHYIILFKQVHNWWFLKTPDPSLNTDAERHLFSLKGMDDLYELFSLLKLINAFIKNGVSLTQIDCIDYKNIPSLSIHNKITKDVMDLNNYYLLENNEVMVELFCEPTIYPYRDNLEKGELFTISKNNKLDSEKPNLRTNTIKTPDYVLKIYNKKSEQRYVYILDAKYSSYETVLYKRLPSKSLEENKKSSPGLVDKYLHGLRVNNDRINMVDGVFATYISGGGDSKSNAIQGIANDYSLMGEYPMSPFVDLIKIEPLNNSAGINLNTFLQKLLEVSR